MDLIARATYAYWEPWRTGRETAATLVARVKVIFNKSAQRGKAAEIVLFPCIFLERSISD